MIRPVALIADDDPAFRETLALALENVGFQVRQVRDGMELLAEVALPESVPDLIISDVEMPRCNGISALAAVRRIAPGVPSIVVTGFADRQIEKHARLRGVDCVMSKPVNVNELCARARWYVGNSDTIPAANRTRRKPAV